MGRAPCCEKVGLKKGSWTAEEDEKLLNYITAHGEGSWKSLPKNAGLLRCGKSCRLRWINYLRADLKRGNITREEEQVIIKMHTTLGNRWSVIAGHLPGRTDNEIKNYWNSHLSRRIHRFRKIGSENEIVTMVLDKVPGRGKGRGGRTSPPAMEKNSTATNAKEKDIKEKGNHDRCSTEEEESDLTLGNPHQPSSTPSVTTTFDDLDQDLWPGEAWGSVPPLMSPDWGMWGPADDLFSASYEDIVGCGAPDLRDCWPGGGPQKEEEVGFCSSSSCVQVEKLLDWDMEAQL